MKETRDLAKAALWAKQGKLSVEALGRWAKVLYHYLTTRELEELVFTGDPADMA